MNQKKIDRTAKEVEKHLEELIKVKLMRIISESMKSKKFTNRWKPVLELLEQIHPGSLKKLELIVKDSLERKS